METPKAAAPGNGLRRALRGPLLLFLAALISSGCTDRRDVRDYYFPVRELTDGRVYEYENTGTIPGPEYDYWYYLGVDQEPELFLSATHYSPALAPDQFLRERITNEAVVLQELTLLNPDSNSIARPVATDILFDRVFPFYLEETPQAYGYRTSFVPPDAAGDRTYVTLNRRYERDTTINILGEERPALLFSLEAEVSLRDREDGDISPTFTGYEVYALGLGLVDWKRDLGEGRTLGGRLVSRIPMEEFAAALKD